MTHGCVAALALLTSHCALYPVGGHVRPGVIASDRPRGCGPRDPGRIKGPRSPKHKGER